MENICYKKCFVVIILIFGTNLSSQIYNPMPAEKSLVNRNVGYQKENAQKNLELEKQKKSTLKNLLFSSPIILFWLFKLLKKFGIISFKNSAEEDKDTFGGN